MAKQIAGLCFMQGTLDGLTYYKMEGQYYCRAKSSLTRKRVKTSPEFKRTMVHASLMARASRIGSIIYKALPQGWRECWMYRSFTGEALTLLKNNPYTDEEVTQILWKTYVEYWEQWEAANQTNPALQIIKAPKQKPVRQTRKYSLESTYRLMVRRHNDKKTRKHWQQLLEEEQKRKEKEKRYATCPRTPKRETQRAKQYKQHTHRPVYMGKAAAPLKMCRKTYLTDAPALYQIPLPRKDPKRKAVMEWSGFTLSLGMQVFDAPRPAS